MFLSVDAEIAFGRWRFCIPSLATQCSCMVDTFVSLALLPWDNLQVSMSIGSADCSFFVFNLSSKFVVTAPFGWFLQSSFNSNNLCAIACEFSFHSPGLRIIIGIRGAESESLLRTRSRSRSRDCLIDSETFV